MVLERIALAGHQAAQDRTNKSVNTEILSMMATNTSTMQAEEPQMPYVVNRLIVGAVAKSKVYLFRSQTL